MKKHEEILLGGMFRPSEQNCPTREGELIESLDKIYDIPNPRVGMRVYVENTGREYIIKSLKEKTIGGVTVPDAMVKTFEEAAGSGATKIVWDANSNMNDFKTAGVYDIYGERTRQDDNLPILNASSGHSIAARLTVVASTLQPANNEICVTQFLQLSNRVGGDGATYVRTYNENNNSMNGWSPWQKLQGVKEGYIFTDDVQVNPDGGVQQIDGVTGLNNMVDNGIYSGIYTDDPTFQAPTFIDTFTLIVINNYAVASKDSRLKRTISQLKYAVDAITNQASVKQRTKTDGSDWTDWTDIGGGGSQEVDITDIILNTSPLYEMALSGKLKEGVNYVVNANRLEKLKGRLDNNRDTIFNHMIGHIQTAFMPVCLKIKYINHVVIIDYHPNNDVSYSSSNEPFYYRYIMDYKLNYIKVSADMTTLYNTNE